MCRSTRISGIVLRVLGAVLLIAAALKGYQLLSEPVANTNIWTYRPFLILQVELELAMGVWLLCGLFRKVAWVVVLACFSLFSLVTLYKGLTGAASCGCFGSVHVNPWITLGAIDLPAVVGLALWRPLGCLDPLRSLLRRQASIHGVMVAFLTPVPSSARLTLAVLLVLAVLGITTPILALNEPLTVTSTYEVLEPESWIGQKLPILDQIDIGDRLGKGTWLLLFYHYDCPDCREAIPKYEQMARDLDGNGDVLRIALVEVPPYGPAVLGTGAFCTLGRLAATKEWFITTPAAALLTNTRVKAAWPQFAPDCSTVIAEIAASERETAASASTRDR